MLPINRNGRAFLETPAHKIAEIGTMGFEAARPRKMSVRDVFGGLDRSAERQVFLRPMPEILPESLDLAV